MIPVHVWVGLVQSVPSSACSSSATQNLSGWCGSGSCDHPQRIRRSLARETRPMTRYPTWRMLGCVPLLPGA